jgi:hypothetical protein
MYTGEISFCGHIGFNIKSDDVKKQILQELETKHYQKIINKHYEKFSSEYHIKHLQQRPHMLSLRSNGNPYYLYLTKVNDVNQCIFIDKKIQNGYIYPRMVLVKFFFADELFEKSTLIDGEMVKTNSNDWLYLMNDLIVERGVYSNVNIMKRVTGLYNILENCYKPAVQDVCSFQVKKYYEYEQGDDMLNVNLDYTLRGIYFTPLFLKYKPILMNFDNDVIKTKIKPKKELNAFVTSVQKEDDPPAPDPIVKIGKSQQQGASMTMFLQKTALIDVYDVFDSENNPHGVAFVNDSKTSKALRDAFANTSPIERKKYTCIYNDTFKKWKPII